MLIFWVVYASCWSVWPLSSKLQTRMLTHINAKNLLLLFAFLLIFQFWCTHLVPIGRPVNVLLFKKKKKWIPVCWYSIPYLVSVKEKTLNRLMSSTWPVCVCVDVSSDQTFRVHLQGDYGETFISQHLHIWGVENPHTAFPSYPHIQRDWTVSIH